MSQRALVSQKSVSPRRSVQSSGRSSDRSSVVSHSSVAESTSNPSKSKPAKPKPSTSNPSKSRQSKGATAKIPNDSLSTAELGPCIEEYLLHCEYQQLANSTIEVRRVFLKNLLWFLNHRELSECSTSELRQFFLYLRKGHEEPGGRWGTILTIEELHDQAGIAFPAYAVSKPALYAERFTAQLRQICAPGQVKQYSHFDGALLSMPEILRPIRGKNAFSAWKAQRLLLTPHPQAPIELIQALDKLKEAGAKGFEKEQRINEAVAVKESLATRNYRN